MIPSPVNSGSWSIAERDRDPEHARVQPLVAEQRDAVDGDRDQARERGVLVDGEHRAAQLRLARDAAGHRQPERHGERDQRERDEPGRAARQPPAVLHRVAAGHAVTASPSSSTSTPPPWRASSSRPASGPESSAAFASASASAAVGASAVALTTPVQAGAPVAGSSR